MRSYAAPCAFLLLGNRAQKSVAQHFRANRNAHGYTTGLIKKIKLESSGMFKTNVLFFHVHAHFFKGSNDCSLSYIPTCARIPAQLEIRGLCQCRPDVSMVCDSSS